MSADQIPTNKTIENDDKSVGVTRLAPSPTGALHLGNARTFLINWAMARQAGERIVLRIEDLDGPRVKAGADAGAIEIMQWLGMDWDEGPCYQRADLSAYQQALDELKNAGLVYPCKCTRRDIEQAQSAPNAGDHELRYPGICKDLNRNLSDDISHKLCDQSGDYAWRLRVPEGELMRVL